MSISLNRVYWNNKRSKRIFAYSFTFKSYGCFTEFLTHSYMVTKKIKLWCFGLNFCSYIDLMAFRTSWKFQSKTMFLSWGVVPSLVENYVSLSSLITSFKWSIILVLNFFKTTSINSHYWSCNINTTCTSFTRRYSGTASAEG